MSSGPKEREAWRVLFYRLKAYQERHGTTRARQYGRQDPELSRWVRAQRALEARGTLLPERYWSLAELGFWRDSAQVRSTRIRPGPSPRTPPSRTKPSPRPSSLRIDLAALRVRAASATGLASQEIAASRAEALVEEWRHRFLELLDYQERFGLQELPGLQEGRWGPLSKWVMSQRAALQRGRMPPARKHLLDAAGFDWRGRMGLNNGRVRSRLEDGWGRGLEELGFEWTLRAGIGVEDPVEQVREFRRRTGHFAFEHLSGEEGLVAWAAESRALRTQGGLEPKTESALDALGFPWTREAALWEAWFAKLQDLIRGGYPLKPSSALARWKRDQLRLSSEGALDGDQERRLEELLARM
ncbi:MAG: helicase associated domain-containing protein [Myxococcota bacterium]|nr:helicase associated domain-containing protein [Myxococcota bacterium]